MTPLHAAINACRLCEAHLAAGPRPIIQFSTTARFVIIGQAPGSRVHETGIPWDDPSGQRLREWTGIDPKVFYDPALIALVPMGFCYPGKGQSGDLPPRPECAPLWHQQILTQLPPERLTLLVGTYAQTHYLPAAAKQLTLTERMRCFRDFGAAMIPLPHPSWRSAGWMKRNPWFEEEVLPELRSRIAAALAR